MMTNGTSVASSQSTWEKNLVQLKKAMKENEIEEDDDEE